MKRFAVIFSLILLSATIVYGGSYWGNQGGVGSVGPAGPTGATGASGAIGATGAAGPGAITSTLTCPTPTGADPANPATGLLLYCKLAGGKVSLQVIFPSGGAQQIAIEP